MAPDADVKGRDTFRIIAIVLMLLGAVAAVGCVVSFLRYRALERASSGNFLTLFALDAAHDRAIACGVLAILLLLAGGILAVVSRRGKHSA
jgi:hypothetical protein